MTSLFKKLLMLFAIPTVFLTGCSKNQYDIDDIPPAVKSYFSVDKTSADINEKIQFKNESENATTYTWDFGDGTTSTEKDPSKEFTKEGTYTVSLKAVGAGGTGNYSTVITIIDNSKNNNSTKDLYFIELGNELIKKVNLTPGSTVEQVADITEKGGVGIAYDPNSNKVYFTDFGDDDDENGKVWRMNPDGSGLEKVVEGIYQPYSIALNLAAKKMYWADDDGNVGVADLDGKNVKLDFIHVEDGNMRGIAYDSKNDMIYFYEVNEEVLYVAKGDGTGVTKLIEGAYGYGVFVDETNGKVYYEDRNEPALMVANLDGSGITKIADAPKTRIHGIAIDYEKKKLYWADRDNSIIYKANLDGSEKETFLSGVKSPRGIFIK